ncbi:MAG: hypothetical protein LBV69_00025 [Bacteroidales bacterium]|nr:hypothetical protein [Bacteroidales bacterium]
MVEPLFYFIKFSENAPLQEFTSSQAMAIPIIANPQNVFILNTQGGIVVDTADSTPEGGIDESITIDGNIYTKSDVLGILTENNVKFPTNSTDTQIIEIINSLSEDDYLKIILAITELTPIS